MANALVRPQHLYAWLGPSLLIVTPRGDCGDEDALTGYYFREARFLRTLRLTIDGTAPWLCEAAALEPHLLQFTYIHPELTEFGGGGTGQSGDGDSTDTRGIPHRGLAIRVTYRMALDGLDVSAAVTNHSRQTVSCDVAWRLDADFADIQEAQSRSRQQEAPVGMTTHAWGLELAYGHEKLPYRARVTASGDAGWSVSEAGVTSRVTLAPQQRAILALRVDPTDAGAHDAGATARKQQTLSQWRDGFVRISAPRSRELEAIVRANVRDFASFPLMEGEPDEWLTLQAGMPVYPALFGRDTLTAGWQAAFLDRGQSLDASLTRLGRMQSDRVNDWRDEQPGRIPYQVRRGPLAILDINPYAAYYADYASPLMFVIALGNLYSWTGETALIRKHWDTARRILDWARTTGDMDGDGYLEYLTRSSAGTKNQGWKDSGDAIIYDDGMPVPAPIATCEVQGYWFAAQQLMSVMSAAMSAAGDARDWWRSASGLKARFNRDWWMEDEGCVALALDPEKRQVRAITSNAGHCIAAGIISAEHLPAAVGRLCAPDMFSGWGIRTLSSAHAAYNPLSYHRGTMWPVEQSTIAFGFRRFGFDARALDLAEGLFALAKLYPDYRLPECVGGYPRGDGSTAPGAYPRANTPQLWNAAAFPLLLHTMLGLQPVAPIETLVIDPVLPSWMPEVILHGLRLAGATVTLRCWRDAHGRSHGELLEKRGTLRLVRQPPPESLSAGIAERAGALLETLVR